MNRVEKSQVKTRGGLPLLCATLLVGSLSAAGAQIESAQDQPGALPEPPALSVPRPTAPSPRSVPQAAPPRRKKAAPVNSAHVKGLKLVERQGKGLYYRRGFVLRVGINVIEADLSDPEVHVAATLASGGVGSGESFSRMVRRTQPAAAITGTFFGMRNYVPTGDLVINGQSQFRGFIGTAVAITEGNLVSFIPTQYKGRAVDWSLYETVIRGGPRLVESGAVTMTARSEGFRTLPISARRTRTAVGLTRDNHLQFVAVRQGITLWELAKVMKAIGAYHAVALDGGTSTAMYFAGRYIANPGRSLSNVLLLYHRRDQYEAMRPRLAAGVALTRTPKPQPTLSPTPISVPTSGFEPAQSLDIPPASAE